MRINACEAIVTRPGRNFVLVKVTTDTGRVGWGDATLNGRELAVASYVNDHLSPLLIGEDPLRIEHLWQSLYVGAYWRGGPVQNSALSGVDTALWDILGKEAGQPVYQLLGGRCREYVTPYVHCSAVDLDGLTRHVRERQAAGFTHIRIQLQSAAGSAYGEAPYQSRRASAAPPVADESHSPTPEETQLPLVQKKLPFVGVFDPPAYLRSVPLMFAHVRAAVGEDVELLHDVHHRLTPTQAARLARELEPYHPFFLEDPVPPEMATHLDQIRRVSTTPIALGEGLFSVDQCLPLIAGRLIDFLRCDLGHAGGITGGRKLAGLAEAFAVKTAWHGPPDLSPVGHAANVHLDLAVANFGVQEWVDHRLGDAGQPARDVFRGGVTCDSGLLDIGDAPGLGITVDEDAARRFAYDRAYLPVCRLPDGTVHPW